DTVEELIDLALILGEDTGGQAILRVVRECERLVERGNRSHHQEWQEELLPEQLVISRQSVDDGRLDEAALAVFAFGQPRAAGADRTALGRGNRLLEAFNGLVVDHRTNVDIARFGIANLERPGPVGQL